MPLSARAHATFLGPAARGAQRELGRHNHLDPGLLAHLGEVVVTDPACHVAE